MYYFNNYLRGRSVFFLLPSRFFSLSLGRRSHSVADYYSALLFQNPIVFAS